MTTILKIQPFEFFECAALVDIIFRRPPTGWQLKPKIFMRDLRTNSAEELLRLHYRVLDELKARGIIRQATAPIGEYAELLFCEALGWARVEKHYNRI